MFIYNITTNVGWNIHEAWLAWMQQEHIPAVMQTKCFVQYQLLKLHEQDETEGSTYIVQYFAESKALYNRYLELYANDLRKQTLDKWGDDIFSFKTLLEVIE